MKTKLAQLTEQLSGILGVQVEITIRGAGRFTFSTEEINHDLEQKCVGAFGALLKLECETYHDDECGTFVFMETKG